MAEVAKRNGQQEVEVWHLLSALMTREWNCARPHGRNGNWYSSCATRPSRELKNLPKLQVMLTRHAPMHLLANRGCGKRAGYIRNAG